jgi:hypothetical protein
VKTQLQLINIIIIIIIIIIIKLISMGTLPELRVQIFVDVNLNWTLPELNPCVMHFPHILQAVQNFHSFW